MAIKNVFYLFILSVLFFHPVYHRALIAANNSFLVSGQTPFGCAFAAKEYSEKTHETLYFILHLIKHKIGGGGNYSFL